MTDLVIRPLVAGEEDTLDSMPVDLATDPRAWLTGPAKNWRIALACGEPVGLAGAAGMPALR